MGADTRPGIVVSVATSGDLLQWHVRMADHIPDPGEHRTLFYSPRQLASAGDQAGAREVTPRERAADLTVTVL